MLLRRGFSHVAREDVAQYLLLQPPRVDLRAAAKDIMTYVKTLFPDEGTRTRCASCLRRTRRISWSATWKRSSPMPSGAMWWATISFHGDGFHRVQGAVPIGVSVWQTIVSCVPVMTRK